MGVLVDQPFVGESKAAEGTTLLELQRLAVSSLSAPKAHQVSELQRLALYSAAVCVMHPLPGCFLASATQGPACAVFSTFAQKLTRAVRAVSVETSRVVGQHKHKREIVHAHGHCTP